MSEERAQPEFDGGVPSVSPLPRAADGGSSSSRSFMVLLIVAVCGTGLWVGSLTQQRRQSNHSGLVVEKGHLDFGEVWSQSDLEWTLPVSNVTSRDIEILSFGKSCNCTVIEPKSLVVRAGESARIRLKLDLRTRDPEKSALPVRDFVVQLFPRVSRPQSFEEIVWEVTGRVRQPLSVSPQKIEFPDVLEGEKPPATQTIRVKCHDAVKELTAQCDETSVVFQLVKLAETSSTYDLIVDLAETSPANDLNCHIVLMAVSRMDETLPAVTVPVSGRVLASIACAPAQLTMGTMEVGQQATKWVTLWSRTGESFAVNDVQAESPLVDVVEQDIDARKSSNGNPFTISLVAKELGPQTTTVRFMVLIEGADMPTELSLPVSYYGTSGDR